METVNLPKNIIDKYKQSVRIYFNKMKIQDKAGLMARFMNVKERKIPLTDTFGLKMNEELDNLGFEKCKW